MVLLYNILFISFLIVSLPVFLVVKLRQADDPKKLLRDRCGFLSEEFKEYVRNQNIIWIHAVSVGEALALKTFVDCLREDNDKVKIIISTVTATGNRIARRLVDNQTAVFYLPLDISFITDHIMRIIKPKVLVLMEAELWPNLIYSAKKYSAKVAIINGRISPRSFRSYYRFKILVKPILEKVDLCLMQNERYAKRMQRMGAHSERVHVSGNMKFDSVAIVKEHAERSQLGFDEHDKIVIAASTHRGEESFLLDVYCNLKKEMPASKLLLVPRHIERTNEITELVLKRNLTCALRDSALLNDALEKKVSQKNFDVYILNTIGELSMMYPMADIVFMGGSIIPHGGQNPLEAIDAEKVVIAGRHTFNFPGIYETLQELGAAFTVTTEKACGELMNTLLRDTERCEQMGKRARSWLETQRGASKRNSIFINNLFTR